MQILIPFQQTKYKHIFDEEEKDPDPNEAIKDLLECTYSSNLSMLSDPAQKNFKRNSTSSEATSLTNANSKDEFMSSILR